VISVTNLYIPCFIRRWIYVVVAYIHPNIFCLGQANCIWNENLQLVSKKERLVQLNDVKVCVNLKALGCNAHVLSSLQICDLQQSILLRYNYE